MILNRCSLALVMLCLSLGLGACAGAVADHWPHWAGGEPNNLPPRPGSPAYQDYVAHRQAEGSMPAPAPAPAATGGTAAMPVGGGTAALPPAAAQSSNPAPTGDTPVARGGLY
jgi:hypothetical protein